MHFTTLHTSRGATKYPTCYNFKGKGNVSEFERSAYDKRVHVYFQENAWMDGPLAVKWIQDTFAPNVDKNAENVLFLDNLNCQTKEQFHSVAKELASTLVYALPPEETDKVQPVDQGEGWLTKTIMGQQLDKYLEKKDNLRKWQSSLSASERRILITHSLGDAWERITHDYPHFRKKLFQKTGLLMTADGSDDVLIKPEGFTDYTF